MNKVNRFVTVTALVAAVGAAVSIAQPERRDPTQPTQPTTPPSTTPPSTTPPVTPPSTTRPGQPSTPPATTPTPPSTTRPGQPTNPTTPNVPGTTPRQPGTTDPTRDPTRDPSRDTTRQPGTTDPTRRDTTRDTTRDMTTTTVTREQVDRFVTTWPVETRRFVTTNFETFGAPVAATNEFVVWHNAGPWEKVMVTNQAYDNTVLVGGPKEFMTTWLTMDVPAAKACDLMRFNPSIMVNQTAHQVGVMSSSQEMAFATFNLAHEIIQGSRTVEDAQRQLVTVSRTIQQGGARDPITMQLNFQPSGGMGTPRTPGTLPGSTTPPTTIIDQPDRTIIVTPPVTPGRRDDRPNTPSTPGPNTNPDSPPRRGP